jgi:hypothetical protein
MRNPNYPWISIGVTLTIIGALAFMPPRTGHTQNGKSPDRDVRVINNSSEPVPVRNVDERGRQPVHIGWSNLDHSYHVPAGKGSW